MIHLLTIITENYIPHAVKFLRSLSILRNIHPMCICVNFDPEKIQDTFDIDSFILNLNEEHVNTHNKILQYGSWLDANFNFNNNDIYIVSDADGIIQRDLTLPEIKRFSEYDDNTVGMSYNAGPDDIFENEIGRLYPACDNINLIIEMQYGPLNRPMYNTGLIVTRKKPFEKVKEEVDKDWPKFSLLFHHYAKLQLLIDMILANNNVKIDVLDYDIHTHGHFNMNFEVTPWDGKILSYHNQPVFFRHNFPRK